MHGFELLRDLLILFGTAVCVVAAFRYARLPPIVAFLATGILCGPSGLGLIRSTQEIEFLAEIGVVLLLFTVGLEFSLEQLARLRWVLVVGGGAQVVVTAGATALILRAMGWTWATAEFFGMLVALSSTAIVVRLISERGEVDTPYGRSALAILIFQDLCVVPMVLITPFLAGQGAGAGTAILVVGLKALAFLAVAGLASRYAVPSIFRVAVSTQRREVFLLTVVVLCLGAAWGSAQVGLSLALGAFIAGLLLSQSEYSSQALGDVLPFRELFNSLFFISIGLLVDVRAIAGNPLPVLGAVGGLLLLKTLIAGAVPLMLGQPLRVAAATGLTLAQVGEFSFVLAGVGHEAGLLDHSLRQGFLAAAVATMALTPWLHGFGARLYRKTGGIWSWHAPWFGRTAAVSQPVRETLRDHVVIVGYGLNGRNVSRVLGGVQIPHVAVDVNPSTVAAQRRLGVPIFYGDATTPETLEHAHIGSARVLVVAISDPPSTRRVVALARRLNPGLQIIVRTHYVDEVRPMLALGARDVIPEEFETSVEIFARVLRAYLVPRDVVERCIREVRSDAYEALRDVDTTIALDAGVHRLLEGLALDTFQVLPGSPLAGRTLGDSALRTRTGATIVALRCGARCTVPNPEVSERIEEGTLAVVMGTPEQLAAAALLFRPPNTSVPEPEVEA